MTTPNEIALRFYESRKAERKAWDTLYQEVADYFLPKRAAFTSPVVKGDNQHDYLYDDTGPWALDQFANGLHSMLVSPLTRWAGLEIVNRDLRNDRQMQLWRDTALEVMYDQWNSSAASFHPVVQENFQDVGGFGFGIGYSEWSEEAGSIMFQARFPGECYLVEDQYGRVSGVVRCYKLDAMQFVEAFGVGSLPETDRQRYTESGQGREYEIVHLVLPRSHPVMAKFNIAERYQYGSVRICKDLKDRSGPLGVGGFRSFPFHIARWGRWTGEVYSTSPGIIALPSVRRANAVQMDLIKISHRWADPPTQGPDDEFLAPYDLSPGARNYYRPGTSDRIEAIQASMGDPRWATQLLQDTQASITRALFVDAFLTTSDSNGQNVKATFVMQRRNERFRQLASMLSRIEREYLASVVERTFDICSEQGLIPPAPREGAVLMAEFLSPIVRAQRSETLDGLNAMVELSAIAAQADPSAMQVFNWPVIQREAGVDVHALPSRWFRTVAEIEEIKRAEMEQAALLQQSQVARNMGGAIKDVSQAAFPAGG